MKTPLTLEQQRDYIRRLQIGWAAASASQKEEMRNLSEVEKWGIAKELQEFAQMFPSPPGREIDPQEHGLVKQQRAFMKAHRRG